MSPLFPRPWSKSSSFTPEELSVLEKLLPQNTSEARALFEQAKQAPEIVRKAVDRAGYEARIAYLDDDSLLVESDCNIRSPFVEVSDGRTGRRLQFSTEVLRGGFLFGLRGVAVDGETWPKNWSITTEISVPGQVFGWLNALPSLLDGSMMNEVLAKLTTWCETDISRVVPREQIRVAPPASSSQVAECETRLSTVLSRSYKEFVDIANGLGIQNGRPYEILGTSDIDYLDDAKKWIGVTPLYEAGYVALREGDATGSCYLLSPRGSTTEIGDLKRHVRETLEWSDADSEPHSR